MKIFKKKEADFQKNHRGRQIFKNNHQLMIKFDENRKLLTMSRRLVLVYAKVGYMGEKKIVGPVKQVELEPTRLA